MTGLHKNPLTTGSYETAVYSIAFLTLVWPATLLRLYVRGYVVKNFGADDVSAIITTVNINQKLFLRNWSSQCLFTAFCTISIVSNQINPANGPPSFESSVRLANVCVHGREQRWIVVWLSLWLHTDIKGQWGALWFYLHLHQANSGPVFSSNHNR